MTHFLVLIVMQRKRKENHNKTELHPTFALSSVKEKKTVIAAKTWTHRGERGSRKKCGPGDTLGALRYLRFWRVLWLSPQEWGLDQAPGFLPVKMKIICHM